MSASKSLFYSLVISIMNLLPIVAILLVQYVNEGIQPHYIFLISFLWIGIAVVVANSLKKYSKLNVIDMITSVFASLLGIYLVFFEYKMNFFGLGNISFDYSYNKSLTIFGLLFISLIDSVIIGLVINYYNNKNEAEAIENAISEVNRAKDKKIKEVLAANKEFEFQNKQLLDEIDFLRIPKAG